MELAEKKGWGSRESLGQVGLPKFYIIQPNTEPDDTGFYIIQPNQIFSFSSGLGWISHVGSGCWVFVHPS